MAFAGRVVRGEARREDCAQYQQPVSITVGGRELHLVPFVERIVKNAVLGLVKELDGYREHAEITVTIGEDS
jgi:molybdopterin-guanine dinucleotide biosynthesis protein B